MARPAGRAGGCELRDGAVLSSWGAVGSTCSTGAVVHGGDVPWGGLEPQHCHEGTGRCLRGVSFVVQEVAK